MNNRNRSNADCVVMRLKSDRSIGQSIFRCFCPTGPDPWWPGYVEEMAPEVAEYLKQQKQQKQQKRARRPAANTARAPISKTARRGSR